MTPGLRERANAPTLRERWPIERVFGVVGFIGGVLAVVFSLGVNWQKLSGVDARLSAHTAYAESTYVRRDVQGETLQRIEQQLKAVAQQQVELQRELASVIDEQRRQR